MVVDDEIPALLLTRDVYKRIEAFTADFRKLERFELFAAVHTEAIDKDIAILDRDLAVLAAKRAEVDYILADQDTGPHPEDYAGLRYTASEADYVQGQTAELSESRKTLVQTRRTCDEEVIGLRADIMRNHFGLSQLLTRILQDSNLVGHEKAQWVDDRRALRSQGLRGIHQWATGIWRHPFAQDHVFQDWRDRDAQHTAEHGREIHNTQAPNMDDIGSDIDEFELCHWNRRVARDAFENRQLHAEAREQNHVYDAQLLPYQDADAWYVHTIFVVRVILC